MINAFSVSGLNGQCSVASLGVRQLDCVLDSSFRRDTVDRHQRVSKRFPWFRSFGGGEPDQGGRSWGLELLHAGSASWINAPAFCDFHLLCGDCSGRKWGHQPHSWRSRLWGEDGALCSSALSQWDHRRCQPSEQLQKWFYIGKFDYWCVNAECVSSFFRSGHRPPGCSPGGSAQPVLRGVERDLRGHRWMQPWSVGSGNGFVGCSDDQWWIAVLLNVCYSRVRSFKSKRWRRTVEAIKKSTGKNSFPQQLARLLFFLHLYSSCFMWEN